MKYKIGTYSNLTNAGKTTQIHTLEFKCNKWKQARNQSKVMQKQTQWKEIKTNSEWLATNCN